MRPRLRPCWRIAINVHVMLALLVFTGWTARAVGSAWADHDMKKIRILANQQIAQMQAEIQARIDLEARETALRTGYAPGDEELCELLYHKDVAVCDHEALQRLAAAAAAERGELSPAQAPRGAASTAVARR